MHRTDLAYSVCNCSVSSPSTNMDAAALRQCLCNAGSPGFSQFRVLIMHFMKSFFGKRGRLCRCCVCVVHDKSQKRRESIFHVLTGVLSVQTTPRAMHRSSSLKRTLLLIPRRILCKSMFCFVKYIFLGLHVPPVFLLFGLRACQLAWSKGASLCEVPELVSL